MCCCCVEEGAAQERSACARLALRETQGAQASQVDSCHKKHNNIHCFMANFEDRRKLIELIEKHTKVKDTTANSIGEDAFKVYHISHQVYLCSHSICRN